MTLRELLTGYLFGDSCKLNLSIEGDEVDIVTIYGVDPLDYDYEYEDDAFFIATRYRAVKLEQYLDYEVDFFSASKYGYRTLDVFLLGKDGK